ncbi:MAG: hypothetical protein LBE25_05930 [Arthrobacter sp.]|jgi:hypothetical protein|nr:hypothetical protein [Arthrobacter sp.]
MTRHSSLGERLVQRAEGASPAAAKELEKAAKKLASFSHAPGDRRAAGRIEAVLTPSVVRALGEEFVAVRTAELEDPDPLWGSEFRQADHAFVALLIAAEDPALRVDALPQLDRIVELIPRLNPDHVEHLNYLSSADTEQDRRIKAATAAALDAQPPTLAQQWAEALGLDLPREHWSLTLILKPEAPDEADFTTPRIDTAILADIKNYPGAGTDWNIRIGVLGMNSLGGSGQPARYRGFDLGSYRREDRTGEHIVEGSLEPAQTPFDFPRIVADLRAAHPELRYDFAKLSASGGPGRLWSAARKKRLRAWLAGEWTPEG